MGAFWGVIGGGLLHRVRRGVLPRVCRRQQPPGTQDPSCHDSTDERATVNGAAMFGHGGSRRSCWGHRRGGGGYSQPSSWGECYGPAWAEGKSGQPLSLGSLHGQ